MKWKLILASASPRRRELLGQMDLTFEICPARGEEQITSTDPEKVAAELSAQKAAEIAQQMSGEGILVIGADTVVAAEGRVLGKPADREDAIRMIRMLQGRTHHVITGVTLAPVGGEAFTFTESTAVHVAAMQDEEILSYVNSGEADDKAGAYGIQGKFGKYVTGIEGDYYNVVGLPIARLYQELKVRYGI